MELACKPSFPGATSIQSAQYTLTHGVTASTATIVCNPGIDGIAPTGDLILSDGQASITIPKMRVEAASVSYSQSGYEITLRASDRRWMWQKFGGIFAHYNVPVPRIHDVPILSVPNQQGGNPPTPDDGPDLPPIQELTQKNARELCKLLLEEMGERSYDISQIPDNDYPEVNWVGAVPANELSQLAEKYGCRVVYDPRSDRVSLLKLGVGIDLPPGHLSQDTIEVEPPIPPARIIVYGAPKKYQVRFELEAVGLDFDGRVKPLDELTYQPILTWKKNGVPEIGPFNWESNTEFANLPGDRTYRDAIALAGESVYRYYRIKNTLPSNSHGDFVFPVESHESGDAFERDHIDLLEHRLIVSENDLGSRVLLGATVYGESIHADKWMSYTQTQPGDEVLTPFSIDTARQLVKFSHKQYIFDPSNRSKGWVLPANLILECACTVREMDTNSDRRYKYELNIGGTRKGARPSNDAQVIVREDIQETVLVNYVNAISNEVNTTVKNTPQCDKQAKHYAEGELAKYQTKVPQQRTYNGIVPIVCDGAIQSVSWSVGLQGVYTSASRHNELSVVVQPYNVRKRQEEIDYARYGQGLGVRPGISYINKLRYAQARDFIYGGE